MEYRKTEKDGVYVFLLKNESNQVYVTNYGATLLSWLVIDGHNNLQDIVLGYDTIEDYARYDGYLGACLGRVANRIAEGRFVLNGQEYKVPVNNGPNSLHGGVQGFSYKTFGYDMIDDSCVRFSLVSPDGDQGYPGTLHVSITYRLENDTLSIHYQAQSDAETLVNLSNHAYFNLDGASTIGEHCLRIAAEKFAPVDENGLVSKELKGLGEAMDFSSEKPIREALGSNDSDIAIAKGLDHPYVFASKKDPVTLYSPKSGLELVLNTSYPLAQIYTANYLDGRCGKHGVQMEAQSAICLEAQYMPDDIHRDPHSKTILRKGEMYDEWTSFTIRKR